MSMNNEMTLASLEALVEKATHETIQVPWPDQSSVDTFCSVMRLSPDGPQMAAQTLAARIHTPIPRIAILALTMTDRCMRKCGPEFHAEIGKFRFLNELIKLVSPKYLGEKTSPEVKTRVLQFLHAWSIEYSKEFKFKVAYDMLKNQGVVKETPPPLPPEDNTTPKVWPKRPDPAFQDKEKAKLLQKLLQSKKPEDIQHANRLIKTMVRQEERREEANSRQLTRDLSIAQDSAILLSEMLDESFGAGPGHLELLHDVHSLIVRTRVHLEEMASGIEECETRSEVLTEILRVNDILDDVSIKYESFVEVLAEGAKEKEATDLENLLDFAGANADSIPAPIAPNNAKIEINKKAVDELGDLFTTNSGTDIAAPLQPVNLMSNDDVSLLGKTKAEGWNELDSLGEQLLKQSLPGNVSRGDNFNKTKTKKIPMNALPSPKHESQTSNAHDLDLDFFTKKPEGAPSNSQTISQPVSQTSDDVMVDITVPPNNNTDICPAKTMAVVESLKDINVTLKNVQPSNMEPIVVYKEADGMMVQLHICKDKPRPDVNVVVISMTSVCPLPIKDCNVQFVVPKSCKVRLLEPSGTSLPPFNVFLPPPALTQIMLIARPAGAAPIALKYFLTFTIVEETFSEMGEIQQFPLDNIH